jgi:hypothetical protein
LSRIAALNKNKHHKTNSEKAKLQAQLLNKFPSASAYLSQAFGSGQDAYPQQKV